ncbi:MAG: dihydroneopterin aldolase [Actinomycetota bacterium]|nr:dihydroneopterin aldolase [Actinomycetota bacterium]
MTVRVELRGLEVPGRHGVAEHERASERVFFWDLWLDVPDTALADRIEETVDYRDVAACVDEVCGGRSFHLLEALAAAAADAIVARFPVEAARVRVRKPRLRVAGLELAESAAVVERRRQR